MATRKALLISGPFSEADIEELMVTMRRIEQRDPNSTYHAMIVPLEENASIEEMERLVLEVFPRLPDQQPDVKSWRRRE